MTTTKTTGGPSCLVSCCFSVVYVCMCGDREVWFTKTKEDEQGQTSLKDEGDEERTKKKKVRERGACLLEVTGCRLGAFR